MSNETKEEVFAKVEDGIYVKRNLSKYNAELDTYKKVNYYYARNFKYYK